MQNWNFSRTILRSMAVVGVLAGTLTILGCGGGEEEVKVAAADTVVSSPTALKQTLPAIEGTTFSLPAGAFAGTTAATALNQATTVRFTNTTAATPTATITAPNGTATGNTTFASCIFTITASTIPGVTVGQVITVNPCQINVSTGGVQATGNATTVQIILQLGLVPSAAQQAQVAINPDTGVVTVNNVNTGQSATLVPTTGTSGG